MTTWTVGQLVTAALMNSNIQALGLFVLSPPLVSAYASIGQSIPNNALTAVLLDTNVLDSDSGHSTTSNTTKYVNQVAGTYLVFGQVAFAANTTGARNATVAKNGTAVSYIQGQIAANNSGTTTTAFIGMLPLAAGDFVEVWALQSSGGTLSTAGGASSLNLLRVSN